MIPSTIRLLYIVFSGSSTAKKKVSRVLSEINALNDIDLCVDRTQCGRALCLILTTEKVIKIVTNFGFIL